MCFILDVVLMTLWLSLLFGYTMFEYYCCAQDVFESLHYASVERYIKVVCLLLDRGAYIHATNKVSCVYI
jgi:hypothetical protein